MATTCVGCGGGIPRERRRDSKFCTSNCRAGFRKAYFADGSRDYPPGAVLYAVRVGDRVYVGATRALRTRLRAFKAGCPDAEFMGAIPGDRCTALKRFQERFAAGHIRGSWYSASPELAAFFTR